jgi:hypothetical protein
MRERAPEDVFPDGLPSFMRPPPRPEQVELARLLEHLGALADDHPLRPALQRDATLLVARGVRPPSEDPPPPPPSSPARLLPPRQPDAGATARFLDALPAEVRALAAAPPERARVTPAPDPDSGTAP